MADYRHISAFLLDAAHVPVIDVRSPAEYAQGHIPGAISMPLFTDEERAVVGTLYKKSGREPAIEKGWEYFRPKMAGFAEKAGKISANNKVLVHCWRGGMRSAAMADLFEQNGLQAEVLTGGYKSFRNAVLESFHRKINMQVVGGETGSGKTEILHALEKLGEQVLDLEAIAHHRGSSFGALGQQPQPTNEQFENNLFAAMQMLDFAKPIWIEDESQSIGRVFIPNAMWEQKIIAPCFRVKIDLEIRVQRLVKDYGHFPKNLLSDGVSRIRKRLGGLATQQALDAIENGNIAEFIRIVLFYYDRAYDHPQSSRQYVGVKFIECETGDPGKNAELILKTAKS